MQATFDILAMTMSERQPRRPLVDFATIPPSQWSMHDRLQNWAKWAHGGSGASARLESASPMFRLFRSGDSRREYGAETTVPIDKDDAIKVAKAVGHLLPQKRRAIHWYYLEGARAIPGAAKALGVEPHELAQLVKDGRTMLISFLGE